MITTVCRKTSFNAAHRLFNPEWSEEKNFEVFGKCSYPNYHGHNYTLIVKVTGEVDPTTGYLMDLSHLASILKEEVDEKYDHRNLNKDIEAFQNLNPTTENFAGVIWQDLRQRINSDFDLRIVLYETERNFVEYEGK